MSGSNFKSRQLAFGGSLAAVGTWLVLAWPDVAPAPAPVPVRAAAGVGAVQSDVAGAAPARAAPLPVIAPSQPRATSEPEVRAIHGELLKRSPAGAVEFAAQLPDGPLRTEMLGRSVPAWAAADWTGTRNWLGSLPEGELKRTALLHAVHGWSEADAGDLLQFAAKLGVEHAQFQSVAAARVAESDRAGALAWATRLPAGPGRDAATVAVAVTWAAANPPEAWRVTRMLPVADLRRAAQLATLTTWARQDLRAAALQVAELPAGDLREAALDELDFQCRVTGRPDPGVALALALPETAR